MTSPPLALEVIGLERRFGERAAVSGLSLNVFEGDLYGFLGPNGSGKTTAIRCILGLLRKDAGQVRIFGEADPRRQRVRVGSVVETPRFHEWLSGRTNLEVACAYAGFGDAADVQRAIDRVGLTERADEPVRRYSLGMKQRLGIARALVGNPRLLVLDEPTNGLDPRGMREVRDLLQELVRRDRITVFVSSHLLAEVQAMCNRVAILDRGVLKAEGAPGELLGAVATPARELELEVDDVAAARTALARLPGVSLAGEPDGNRLRLRIGDVEPRAVNRELVTAGVGVSSLIPVTRSLEDEFLAVTADDPELARRA